MRWLQHNVFDGTPITDLALWQTARHPHLTSRVSLCLFHLLVSRLRRPWPQLSPLWVPWAWGMEWGEKKHWTNMCSSELDRPKSRPSLKEVSLAEQTYYSYFPNARGAIWKGLQINTYCIWMSDMRGFELWILDNSWFGNLGCSRCGIIVGVFVRVLGLNSFEYLSIQGSFCFP